MLRVRIIAVPKPGEIDEYDIRRRFRIGQTYELPLQLATLLMVLGYAEGVADERAQAADILRR